LIAGHGCLRYEEIFKTMIKSGYEGNISLELYPYVDNPVEAGKESIEYLLPLFKDAGW